MEQRYEDTRFENAVDKNFHCPICMNIFKEPVQCRRNEHYFCTPCITRHLEQNSQSCPLCMEELTVEILQRPPRIVTDYLHNLKISCDFTDRGCGEMVLFGVLKPHTLSCKFSPVTCSNDGCLEAMNIKDQNHHETQVCGFKKIKCDDCGEMVQRTKYKAHCCVLRSKIAEIKLNWTDTKDQLSRMLSKQEEMMKEMKTNTTEVKGLIMKEIKSITTELNKVKQSVQDLFVVNNHISFRKDIVVVDGFEDRYTALA